MNISNSQIKALIEVHDMINNSINGMIPLTDISNKYKLKRFEKVLNDLLVLKIEENDKCNDLYIKTRKGILDNEK